MTSSHQPPEQADQPAFTRLEHLTAVIVVGVLALALGVIALGMPSHHVEKRGVGYTQSGRFAYTAPAPAGSVYGPHGLSAGEPILLDVVGPVTTTFDYRLDTSAPSALSGTAALSAEVTATEGLSRTFPIVSGKAFNGDRVRISGVLPVAAIRRYLRTAQTSLGSTGADLASGSAITVVPTIKVRGSLSGHELRTTFAPKLDFTANGSTLVVGGGDLSGPTSGDAGATDPLKSSKTSTLDVSERTTNTVSLLVAHPSVVLSRFLGLGLALLCLLLGLWLARPLLRSGGDSERARIQALYGGRIVEVDDLALPRGPIATVAHMDALADVAKRYESVIMHLTDAEGDAYLVWDDGLLYRYRPSAAPLRLDTARTKDDARGSESSGSRKARR